MGVRPACSRRVCRTAGPTVSEAEQFPGASRRRLRRSRGPRCDVLLALQLLATASAAHSKKRHPPCSPPRAQHPTGARHVAPWARGGAAGAGTLTPRDARLLRTVVFFLSGPGVSCLPPAPSNRPSSRRGEASDPPRVLAEEGSCVCGLQGGRQPANKGPRAQARTAPGGDPQRRFRQRRPASA